MLQWLSKVCRQQQCHCQPLLTSRVRVLCSETSGRMSAAAKPSLTFVTGNVKKLEEVQAIIGEHFPWTLVSKDVDVPELQGEPEDIAREKCKLAADNIKGPVITEDTSLCYTALQGLPGPYIKWFLTKLGHEGLNNLLAAYTDKTAYAQCIFAFTSGPGEEVTLFTGRTQGIIVPARGPCNFGWDPVFQPDGFEQTYAQLEPAVKNAISHRYKAVTALKEHFTTPAPPTAKKQKNN